MEDITMEVAYGNYDEPTVYVGWKRCGGGFVPIRATAYVVDDGCTVPRVVEVPKSVFRAYGPTLPTLKVRWWSERIARNTDWSWAPGTFRAYNYRPKVTLV